MSNTLIVERDPMGELKPNDEDPPIEVVPLGSTPSKEPSKSLVEAVTHETLPRQVKVEQSTAEKRYQTMGYKTTSALSNPNYQPDLSNSSLPNLKSINLAEIFAPSKQTNGSSVVMCPGSLSQGVYCLVVESSSGANNFTILEAYVESSTTVDTYRINVG